jgi:hypothetical protein
MSQYRDFGPQDDPDQSVGDSQFLGVNTRLAADQLPPGMLADAQNARLRSGQPETRPGVVKPGWLNAVRPGLDSTINPVGTFYGVGNFRDPNGLEWVLLAADGDIFRCRANNARFALALPAGVRLLTPSVPVQAFNRVYLFRGRHLPPLLLSDIDAGFTDLLPRWSSAATYQAAVQALGILADEIAYGPFQTVSSLTSVGGTATVVTPAEHGFITGADVVLTGANEAAYNGRWNIVVLDVNTFTFAFAGAASPATGTIKVSNMALYWKALGTVRAPLISLTRVGATATATFNGHGFTNGQYVTISGATPVAYNGTWVIQNVTANTWDYVMPADPGANASGVITAQTSVVLAGQSPDTNPEAWQQIFNVLPNADDALFIDNRLLVPTAYTPGATDYDNTSSYTKKDFIVAMDIGDDVHFAFTNELRINQGSSDEIVTLVKYDADTVVVVKGVSWGVLTGLSSGDLGQVQLDMRQGYGGCAPRSAVAAGKNVLFPSSQRGIVSLQQTLQGETRGVDVPFSNDMEAVIKRIDWSKADKIRLAYWDDKLYAAVPLLDFQSRPPSLIPAGAQYTSQQVHPGIFVSRYEVTSLLTVGQAYHFTPAPAPYPSGDNLGVNGGFLLQESDFVYQGGRAFLFPGDKAFPEPVVASLTLPWVAQANNAILVYDFRRAGSGNPFAGDYQPGQWDGYDTGASLCVQEFFTATYSGRLRLFFIAENGYVNLMEEAGDADQIGDPSQANGLNWAPINCSVDSRGYNRDTFNRCRGVEVVLGVWNARYSVSTLTGAASSLQALRADQSFSRTRYLKPVGKPDYVEGNANGDFATPGRGDYSVRLLPAGITPGFSIGQFQELVVRISSRPTLARFIQVRVTNNQGRLRLKGLVPAIAAGPRRQGVLV